MEAKIIKKLMDVGFDQKDAQVYLSALESGKSPASIIARKAGLNRVTTYGVLQELAKEGIVQITKKKDISHFIAVDPEILIENINQRAKNLERALPNLKSLISDHEFTVSRRFFEGLEGVKEAYEETLSAKEDILNYANSRNIREHWPKYDEEYVRARMERGIFLRGIYPKDKYGKQVQVEDEQYLRSTRLIKSKNFWIENEIKIFDDKFFIASFEPSPFAILIQSQTIADSQKQIFEIAWGFSEK